MKSYRLCGAIQKKGAGIARLLRPSLLYPFPVALYLRVLIRSELAAVYVTICYSFCFPAPVPGRGLAGIGKMLWHRRQNPACRALRHTGHEATGGQPRRLQMASMARFWNSEKWDKSFRIWWTRGDSNPRPPRCERGKDKAKMRCHNHLAF